MPARAPMCVILNGEKFCKGKIPVGVARKKGVFMSKGVRLKINISEDVGKNVYVYA